MQDSAPLASSGKASLAELLTSAGYREQAEIVLGSAKKDAQNSAGWMKMDQLAALKNAQTAMGDESGKTETAEQMQAEIKDFEAVIAKANINTNSSTIDGKQVNVPVALNFIHKARAVPNSEEAKKDLQQALQAVGNNIQLLEVLSDADAEKCQRAE